MNLRSFTSSTQDIISGRRYMSSSSLDHSSECKSPAPLSHFNNQTGRAQMVDVGSKAKTSRMARASGRIYIPEVAYKLILFDDPDSEYGKVDLDEAKVKVKRKGDVLATAQIAGIMACKQTSNFIPLCHPLQLSHVEVVLTPEMNEVDAGGKHKVRKYSVLCRATASYEGKTGVEMEALTAVSVALLTVWDMLKAVAGKEMIIGEIFVEDKTGGKSGDFHRAVDAQKS